MQSAHRNAPPPDLRIVSIESVQAHEEHDNQRSDPLVERLRNETVMINPPLVAPMGENEYVVLDGANRCHSLARLEYPHILVQVTSYESGYVELDTWRHVVSEWDVDGLLAQLEQIHDIDIEDGQDAEAVMHFILRDRRILAIKAAVNNTHEKNAALRKVVKVYQRNARLNRTAINEPEEVWELYPKAIALAIFPEYQPADIIAAARYRAYLPAGISRHIIHGRALRVNYPLQALRDRQMSLSEKNNALQLWIQEKLAKRSIRYYAEATYQFDE